LGDDVPKATTVTPIRNELTPNISPQTDKAI
jgi:hypothetical protein